MGSSGRWKRKRKKPSTKVSLQGRDRTFGEFFLDSGAHSLYNDHVLGKKGAARYAYYDTPDFWKYVDDYAAFVKKYAKGLDYYANVDVIYNPEKSWEALKYLEDKHGLRPVPVIHAGTDLKWVERHLKAGYDYLGIGGLGQETPKQTYTLWGDRLFDMLCPPPSRMPAVRTHGFAMTAYDLIIRYPWWSVDSASWAKAAGFGRLYVPHKRKGQFTFDVNPYLIVCSMSLSRVSRGSSSGNLHYSLLEKAERVIVQEWLDSIGIPLGKVDKDGKTVEYGVLSEYNARAVANLKFFEAMCAGLPEWPWAFKVKGIRRGFSDLLKGGQL
jgi:hypothetical protein